MKLNRLLLAVVIAAAHACSALAQDAAPANQGQLAASEPASATTLQSVYKDHFLIGVAINRSIATGEAGRRGQELVEKDIALVKEQFNQLAPENDLKWQLIHPREGADGYDFGPADAFVEFGQKHNMHLIGHTLVWHSQTPNWVFAGTTPPPGADDAAKAESPPAAGGAPPGRRGRPGFGGGFGRGFTGPRATREELLERMREHIHTVVGRYKGKIKAWDVVNEAIADNGEEVLRDSLWLQIIGPDYIAKAFEYAHEADPEAILRYNDYGLENPAKRQKLLKLVKSLQEQKVPIHAIGSQAHVNVSTTFETMDQSLSEMATLGLPIHITELDVNTAARGQRGTGADIGANADATRGGQVSDADKRLADAYAGIFRAFVKHRENVKMVTFWGANDAVSWRRFGSPLLFDGDNRPKPAFQAVIRVAHESPPKSE
jgi:endo-1,4-beta-xylanase